MLKDWLIPGATVLAGILTLAGHWILARLRSRPDAPEAITAAAALAQAEAAKVKADAEIQRLIQTGFKDLTEQLQEDLRAAREELAGAREELAAARSETGQLRSEIAELSQICESMENLLRREGLEVPERRHRPRLAAIVGGKAVELRDGDEIPVLRKE